MCLTVSNKTYHPPWGLPSCWQETHELLSKECTKTTNNNTWICLGKKTHSPNFMVDPETKKTAKITKKTKHPKNSKQNIPKRVPIFGPSWVSRETAQGVRQHVQRLVRRFQLVAEAQGVAKATLGHKELVATAGETTNSHEPRLVMLFIVCLLFVYCLWIDWLLWIDYYCRLPSGKKLHGYWKLPIVYRK